jgi:peptidyl-prolyl cis-trans isomerase D
MFDAIRNQKKVLMGILLVLVIPAFVLFGVEGYTRYSEQSEAVAVVDGKDITRLEWDNAHRQEIDRLRESMPGIDIKLLDTEQARYAALERLVRERVLAAAADTLHVYTSDQKLTRELTNNATIASLRTADGKLDVEAYRTLLGRQGLTPEMFEANIRAELSRVQVIEGIGATTLAGPAVANAALDAFFQRRAVRVLALDPAAYTSKVVVTDADLQAYYQSNEAQFKTVEQADVQYVLLDLPTLERQIVLNEADVKAYYEQNAARLSGGEERRASHVLLSVPEGTSAEAKAAIRAKAEALQQELTQNPSRFAEVAKAQSQDPGSAVNGGDLDYFARGAMVKPFEDAAFALAKGAISPVVESDFGFHIIQVTDIRAPKQRPFEDMRAELEADLKRQQAQKRYAEIAEQFSNLAYEQADTLQPMVDKLKLELRSAQGVLRDPVGAPNADPVLTNPSLLQALFAADAVNNKRNTQAIEIGSNRLVAARIVKHMPARTQALDEVKAAVQQQFIASKAAELARTEGAALLKAAQGGQAPAGLSEEITVSREKTGNLPLPVMNALMSAPASQLPAWTGVDLGPQGYAVLQITAVQPREAVDDQRRTAERGQVRQWLAAAETAAYYETLKQRFKVKILAPQPKP